MYNGSRRNFFENLVLYFILFIILSGVFFLFFSNNFKINIDLTSYYNSITKQIDELWSNTRFADEKKIDINNTSINEVNQSAENLLNNRSYLKYNEITSNTLTNDKIEENNKTKNKIKKETIIKKIEKTKIVKKEVLVVNKDKKVLKKENISIKSPSVTKIFLESTKTKVLKNIYKLDKYKVKNAYANIRITILKNGSTEQLTFVDGNIDYFKYISSTILKSFPVKIDKRIQNQFPRYFRLNIKN